MKWIGSKSLIDHKRKINNKNSWNYNVYKKIIGYTDLSVPLMGVMCPINLWQHFLIFYIYIVYYGLLMMSMKEKVCLH